VYYK